jgi:hypothetical protein
VSVEEKLVGAVDALTAGRTVVTLFQNEDIFVERLGFCLTDMGTLGKESAAPIYVQTFSVDVISSSL